MENFAYILIMIVVVWVFVLFSKDIDPISDEDLSKLIKHVHEQEKDLKQMNFINSEIDRISEEKSKAIKSHDWDLLKKLWQEEENNRIIFKYLSNKNQ